MIVRAVTLLAALATVVPALAATDVVALTPEARMAAIDAAATRTDSDTIAGSGRGIHGEMGIMFGNHGTRALYGTTVVPLGQNSVAAFSFLTSSENFRSRR